MSDNNNLGPGLMGAAMWIAIAAVLVTYILFPEGI